MRPKPENITGEVTRSHRFEHKVVHSINWSHILFALVALVAIYALWGIFA